MSIEALNWALSVRTGSPSAKSILLILANRADDNGKCWPAIDGISEQTELSSRTVRQKIRVLEDHGFVSVQHRGGDGGGRKSNIYVLNVGANGNCRTSREEPNGNCRRGNGKLSQGLTANVAGANGECRTQTHKDRQLTLNEPTNNDIENLNTDAWQEYIAYRRSMKFKNLKPVSEKKQQVRMAKFSMTVQAEAVDKTIANGWQGLFPEMIESNSSQNGGSDPFYDSVRQNIALVKIPDG